MSSKLFKQVNKYENHTPTLFKNIYCITEILIKEKNIFNSFHFRVFVYFCNYVLRCSYIFTFSVNEAHCSYLVLFIGLFFLNHMCWLYELTIFKGTVMQIKKAPINDCLHVSKVS